MHALNSCALARSAGRSGDACDGQLVVTGTGKPQSRLQLVSCYSPAGDQPRRSSRSSAAWKRAAST